MKNVFLLLRKDFKRKGKNPVVIIGFLLMPLIFTLILGMVFGYSDEPSLPSVSLLAADNDQSLLSKLFLGAFSQGEMKDLINLDVVDEETGRRKLDKGKASALLIIPENFGKDILDSKPVEILLLKNPAQQFLPQIVEEIGNIYTLLASAFLAVFSDEMKIVKDISRDENITDEIVSMISLRIRRKIEGMSKYVLPPIISINQQTIQATKEGDEEEANEFSFHEYALPGISIMFLLFICNLVFEDLLREKESGTLLRMMVSPMRVTQFIWSKILTSIVLGILCTYFLILLGHILFPVDWGNQFLLFAIVLCLNILIAGFIASLYSFIRTERQAGAILSTVILVMSMLGGSMIPAQLFPSSIRIFSKLTLNYWGIEGFYKVMRGAPIREILPFIIGMCAAGILLANVGAYFLNSRLQRGLFK